MCYRSAHHPRWGRHHRKHHAKRWWKNKFRNAWAYPPVSVEEFDNRYEILFYAAGYAKEDFQVGLRDNTLIVAGNKTDNEAEDHFYYRPWNFRPGNFERRFELNEKIDKEAISAKYEEGILNVTLQKLAGSETVQQDIDIV